MSGAVLIMTTVASSEEADTIAAALVAERLAACVQSMPIASVYRWQGKVERAGEVALHIKTSALLATAVEARIIELHSYGLPEIVTLSIVGGSPAYLAWIVDETRP